jgi:hypothetical protein
VAHIKIAVGGPHSTGKSTFIAGLKEALEARKVDCKVVGDLASQCPLPILEEHTIESTLWIVMSGIAQEIAAAHQAKVVLVDRPVVDAWAYLMAGKNGGLKIEGSAAGVTLRNAIRDWLPTYGLIYQSVLNDGIAIEATKGRILIPAYRSQVARQMDIAYSEFSVRRRALGSDGAEYEREFVMRQVSSLLDRSGK